MTFRTVHYTIGSKRILPEFNNYRIIHLSDLHGSLYGRDNEDLVRRIRQIDPHIIVMTGDMADTSPRAIQRFENLCCQLCDDYPVYYVEGNHEQEMEGKLRGKFLKTIREMGAITLKNQQHKIFSHGAFIKIYGLVTPMVYYKDILKEYQRGITFSSQDAEDLLGKADDSCYKILLAHNPLYYPSYRDWGADLTLSGHIHGGIIRIPKLGGLLSPDLTFFPKYDGGHFKEVGKHLIVSRGLGNHFLVRVFNPPELVSITLRSVPHKEK